MPSNLTLGSSGSDVDYLQMLLMNLGYLPTNTLPGTFGPATQDAVRQFQRQNGLGVDGIVGPNTWAALGSGNAVMSDGSRYRASGTDYSPPVSAATNLVGPGPSTRVDFTEGSIITASAPGKVQAWWAGMTPVGKAFTVSLGLGVGLLVFGGGKKR